MSSPILRATARGEAMVATGTPAGTVIDLFCGCGGFSLGAELAGFRSLASVDVEPTLQSGYRRNFPRTRAIQADVADLAEPDWRMVLGSRIRPDGLIGGPPCQGFSAIGKRREGDARNSLVGEFFRQVCLLRPRFFVMENVEGILRPQYSSLLEDALSDLPSSYIVLDPVILNARDFGAATKRRRVAIIGYDANEFPMLTAADFLPDSSTVPVTVRDAISDLPGPISQNNVSDDLGWAAYPCVVPISDYAMAARMRPPSHLGSPEAHERHLTGQVSGLFETVHSAEMQSRYSAIANGKSDPITKSYKLDWNGHCPTLRAGTGRERGAFQAVRPLHPTDGRVITVREAARLQGFPDWFEFHRTKWQSFRMIGNSVSPYVSFALLSKLADKLRSRIAA